RPDDLDIFGSKAGGAKAGGHGLSSRGDIANRRVCCVDLNQLFENVTGKLMLWSEAVLLGKGTRQHDDEAEDCKGKFDHCERIINSRCHNLSLSIVGVEASIAIPESPPLLIKGALASSHSPAAIASLRRHIYLTHVRPLNHDGDNALVSIKNILQLALCS